MIMLVREESLPGLERTENLSFLCEDQWKTGMEDYATRELSDLSQTDHTWDTSQLAPYVVNSLRKAQEVPNNAAKDFLRKNQVTRLKPLAPEFIPLSSSTAPEATGIVSHVTEISSLCHCYYSQISCVHFCTLYSDLPLPIKDTAPISSELAIRLMIIKPGFESDPLDCTLFRTLVSASTPTRFIALSYVWGDTQLRQLIIVNGRIISIAQNLHSALKRLRQPHDAIVLWVDAICIDQQNLEERSSQVQQMPRIYGAADVVAWLGESNFQSSLAMRYIAEHGRQKKRRTMPCESEDGDIDIEIKVALKHLWDRPYWSRVWVVQELASAVKSRNRCVFQCGGEIVSYSMMLKFTRHILQRFLFTKDDPISKPRRMLTLSFPTSRLSILELLWNSALLQSSDPRDRIYGIRGICSQYYNDTIKVDYTIDFPTLCRKFMAYNIKKERSLDILCYFYQFSMPGSPSWLCDLRYQTSGMDPFTYSCSASRKAHAKITKNTLAAKGIRLGVINDVRGPYQFQSLDWSTDEQLVVHQYFQLQELEQLTFKALHQRYPNDIQDVLENRFMDMVAGSRHYAGESARQTKFSMPSRELWERISGKVAVPGILLPDVDSQFMVVFERLNGRSFFTTFNNHVGLGPPNMRQDDVLCILYGCSMCVVLRQMSNGYFFVGPAYVDGAMSGEYTSSNKANCRRKAKEMMFSIV